jgi:predicted HTH domain antitoxin
VLCEWQNGRLEVIRTSLTDYGSPSSNTAIARTVVLPASIAVKLILEGRISVTGVQRPVLPEIYIPILAELADMGIQMKEEYNLSSEVLPVIN